MPFWMVSEVGQGLRDGCIRWGPYLAWEGEVLGVSPINLNNVFECSLKTEMYSIRV